MTLAEPLVLCEPNSIGSTAIECGAVDRTAIVSGLSGSRGSMFERRLPQYGGAALHCPVPIREAGPANS